MRRHYPGQMKKKMCIIINQGICSAHKGRRGAGVHPNEAEQLPVPDARLRARGAGASGWLHGDSEDRGRGRLRGTIVRGRAKARRWRSAECVQSSVKPPPPCTTHAFFLKTILRAPPAVDGAASRGAEMGGKGGGNGVGWTKSCGDSAGIGGAVPPRLHQDGAQREPSLPISARIVSSSGVWSSRPRAGHGPELRRGDERGGSLAGLGPRSVRTVGKGRGGAW